jgi:murein L,D-transpeptidase YafK
MIRIFKSESQLELWMRKDGRFALFATYPICFWSGKLGPKEREGDRQAPEGLYTVGLDQLHVVGRHPRSLNVGFPNAFDRAFGRTGSYILVHGGCTSIGCFAMTDPLMDEIYALSEQALRGGQQRIQVQIFPFRMTEANLAPHTNSKWYGFWRNLKEAYDAFEPSRMPPAIGVCRRTYTVTATDTDADQPATASVLSNACEIEPPIATSSPAPSRMTRLLAKPRLAGSHTRRPSLHTARTRLLSRATRSVSASRGLRKTAAAATKRVR